MGAKQSSTQRGPGGVKASSLSGRGVSGKAEARPAFGGVGKVGKSSSRSSATYAERSRHQRRILVATSLDLQKQMQHLPGVTVIGTDIAQILQHMREIQASDVALFLDDGGLFDLPRTGKLIRQLLLQLTLITHEELQVIDARFTRTVSDEHLLDPDGFAAELVLQHGRLAPIDEKTYRQAYDAQPLMDPFGYAIDLLAYDYRDDLLVRQESGYTWNGTKETEDPVAQRRRLTTAIAHVVADCFGGGRGEVEQHVWVLLSGPQTTLRMGLLNALFGPVSRGASWAEKGKSPAGPVQGLCHELTCAASHWFARRPGRDGMCFGGSGRSWRKTPLRNDKGEVSGISCISAKMNMVWVDISVPASLSDLRTCLNQFNVLLPAASGPNRPSVASAVRLVLTSERRSQASHSPKWVVVHKIGTSSTEIEMGHRAFLLLLAHVVSAKVGDVGIDPKVPEIRSQSIERCYTPRQSNPAKPAQQIRECFRSASIQDAVIAPVARDPNTTQRILYQLTLPAEHVELSELTRCGNPDVQFLLALLQS